MSFPPTQPVPVGILGATGTVGQRFVLLLAEHPFFAIRALGASARSAGRPYADAARHWMQPAPIPAHVRDMPVHDCRPEHFAGCKIVFSGLDADVAGEIESAFRAAEFAVFSNAKNFRRDPHVPLIVPLVNPSHFAIVRQQRALHAPALRTGFILTNANCSTTGLVVPLSALERAFGPVEACLVSTMQALSGAGYPGVPALDAIDNVLPHIPGEEEKIEWETLKILSGLTDVTEDEPMADSADTAGMASTSAPPPRPRRLAFDMRAAHPLRVSASCQRVPVLEGHTASVSVRFARRPPPSPQQVREALAGYTCEAQSLGCPSAPRRVIMVHEASDRPQPRLDRDRERGAGVEVGRVRQCRVLDIKFVIVANNVAIGAATSSIINAEIALAKGIVEV